MVHHLDWANDFPIRRHRQLDLTKEIQLGEPKNMFAGNQSRLQLLTELTLSQSLDGIEAHFEDLKAKVCFEEAAMRH